MLNRILKIDLSKSSLYIDLINLIFEHLGELDHIKNMSNLMIEYNKLVKPFIYPTLFYYTEDRYLLHLNLFLSISLYKKHLGRYDINHVWHDTYSQWSHWNWRSGYKKVRDNKEIYSSYGWYYCEPIHYPKYTEENYEGMMHQYMQFDEDMGNKPGDRNMIIYNKDLWMLYVRNGFQPSDLP